MFFFHSFHTFVGIYKINSDENIEKPINVQLSPNWPVLCVVKWFMLTHFLICLAHLCRCSVGFRPSWQPAHRFPSSIRLTGIFIKRVKIHHPLCCLFCFTQWNCGRFLTCKYARNCLIYLAPAPTPYGVGFLHSLEVLRRVKSASGALVLTQADVSVCAATS